MLRNTNRRVRRVMAVVAALVLAAACGGSDGGPTGGTQKGVQVSATPAALTVQQGATETVNAQLTRAGGFDGPVTVAVSGLPAGITTTVTPAQLTGATTTATIAVAVANTVAPGAYTATVTATGTGITGATAQYQVTVTAAPAYTLTLAPATVTVAPGANGTSEIAIARTNFTGAVALSLEGAPAGVTATFAPAAPTTNASTLSIAVGATVLPGTYALSVKGTANGLADRTAPLTLTVPAPAFTITPAPNAVTVSQGSLGTSVITIGRTHYAGNVTLSLDAPPAGITATFAPATTNGTTSNLTLNVGGNVDVGTYQLTVRGTAPGLINRVAQLTLTVTPAPGTMLVAVNPATITVPQGGSGQATATLTRTNLTGAVTFSATNVPAGVAIAYAPATTNGNTSTAAITAAPGTATGTHQVTIVATGPGGIHAFTTLSVTVVPPAQGGTGSWQFCSPLDTPVLFAYQDGTGVWQRAHQSSNGVATSFDFTLTQGRGGVAYITQVQSALVGRDASAVASHSRIRQAQRLTRVNAPGASLTGTHRASARQGATRASAFGTTYRTHVFYGTTAELAAMGADNCAETQPTKLVRGTVAGLNGGQVATVSLGGATTQAVGGMPSDIEFLGVPYGLVDLVGTRAAFGSAPDRVVLQRNLNVPNGGALPSVIDFDAATAFAPATATATITNGMNDELFLSTMFATANGESGFLSQETLLTTNPVRTWAGVPTARLVNGDLHGLFVFASPDFEFSNTQRLLFAYLTQVGNTTLALGPNIDVPTMTMVSPAPYPRFRFQGLMPVEYRSAVSVSIAPLNANGNEFEITATHAYFASAGIGGTYDITMPDLTWVNGFVPASRLTMGGAEVTVQAIGWNGAGIVKPRPQAGDLLRAAVRSTSVNVP